LSNPNLGTLAFDVTIPSLVDSGLRHQKATISLAVGIFDETTFFNRHQIWHLTRHRWLKHI